MRTFAELVSALLLARIVIACSPGHTVVSHIAVALRLVVRPSGGSVSVLPENAVESKSRSIQIESCPKAHSSHQSIPIDLDGDPNKMGSADFQLWWQNPSH
jgi:hypothetical protein